MEETSEIRFVIEEYNDIFSDFDPRQLSQRSLSEDFLSEAKRASIDKNGNKINFVILTPQKERKLKDEIIIKERLKKHFKKHFSILEKERKKIVKIGAAFTISGIILMVTATFLFFRFRNESLIASFLTILLEPASWFLFWEGLSQIIFESKKIDPNLNFYKKMSESDIKFHSINH